MTTQRKTIKLPLMVLVCQLIAGDEALLNRRVDLPAASVGVLQAIVAALVVKTPSCTPSRGL
jgi:hypothetical protein